MNNLLPRSVPMHLKYDMKGSTCKRRASPKEREKRVPTYKDLDFNEDMPEGIQLEPENHNALSKTIQRDCLVSMHACVWVLLHASLKWCCLVQCIVNIHNIPFKNKFGLKRLWIRINKNSKLFNSIYFKM